MIVAFLNHKGGVGKTTLALHVAGAWAAQGKRVVVVDTDSQGSALDWSEQRTKGALTRLFDVLALARDTLHVETPDVDHVVIDGSSRITALIRSAMLAADLALVPAQPSPFDGWAAAETLRLLHEAQRFRPQLIARFVLNRCGARTLIASEIAETIAKHEAPALVARIGQRVVFADAARTGRLVSEMPRSNQPHARSLRSPLRSSGLPDDEPRPQTRIHVTATRCGDVDMTAHKNGTKAHHFMARLTIDVTPDLRGRIKVAAFRRGITVAAMLRNLLSREFPPQPRDAA